MRSSGATDYRHLRRPDPGKAERGPRVLRKPPMSDEPDSWRDTSNEGGVTGKHPTVDTFEAKVAPTFADELNTIKDQLVVVACWRLDDIRFEFASSFIRPEATDEFAQLASLRAAHPGAPISIFGHADPVGDDEFNKQLSGRRAKAVYALLLRDVAAWEALYANTQDRWGDKAVQIMLDTLGYAPGRTDGTMDAGTQTALRNI